jgi:hypothetical protein
VKFRLAIPLLLFYILAPRAHADGILPCSSGTVAQVFNTTCAIGNLGFVFGQPFVVDSNVDPTQIAFTPIADGFKLGGLNQNTPTLFPGPGEFFLLLPVVQISTLNGQPTIDGLTTSIVGGTFSPNSQAFSFLEQCLPGGLVTAGAEQTAFGGINGAATFPAVSSTVSCGTDNGATEILFAGPNASGENQGPGSFAFTTYQVSQVAEPGTMTLVLIGIAFVARRRQPRRLTTTTS